MITYEMKWHAYVLYYKYNSLITTTFYSSLKIWCLPAPVDVLMCGLKRCHVSSVLLQIIKASYIFLVWYGCIWMGSRCMLSHASMHH